MSISVLLADDHKVVCDGLEVLLNSEADIHVIGQAGDGQEAIRCVEKLRPDIVIMDINMPVKDGLAATKEIVERYPPTRIIILSMYAQKEFIFRSLQAGVKGYLLKESAGIEVVDAIRTVLAGGRYLSQKITDEVIDEYIQLRQGSHGDHPLVSLTPREREVLQLIVDGNSRVDIAECLNLSKKTVDTYRNRIMKKLDVHDIPSLVKFALQHGITTLD